MQLIKLKTIIYNFDNFTRPDLILLKYKNNTSMLNVFLIKSKLPSFVFIHIFNHGTQKYEFLVSILFVYIACGIWLSRHSHKS